MSHYVLYGIEADLIHSRCGTWPCSCPATDPYRVGGQGQSSGLLEYSAYKGLVCFASGKGTPLQAFEQYGQPATPTVSGQTSGHVVVGQSVTFAGDPNIYMVTEVQSNGAYNIALKR